MIERMCEEVSDPFRNHDGDHDWQQELNVIREFHLRKKSHTDLK